MPQLSSSHLCVVLLYNNEHRQILFHPCQTLNLTSTVYALYIQQYCCRNFLLSDLHIQLSFSIWSSPSTFRNVISFPYLKTNKQVIQTKIKQNPNPWLIQHHSQTSAFFLLYNKAPKRIYCLHYTPSFLLWTHYNQTFYHSTKVALSRSLLYIWLDTVVYWQFSTCLPYQHHSVHFHFFHFDFLYSILSWFYLYLTAESSQSLLLVTIPHLFSFLLLIHNKNQCLDCPSVSSLILSTMFLTLSITCILHFQISNSSLHFFPSFLI
jgi:hypothetical protein